MAKKHFTKGFGMDKQVAMDLIKNARRESDDFVNATLWCQGFGREFSDFKRLPDVQKFIESICRNLNLRKSQVLEIKRGKGGGTFVHPLLSIKLAEWLDKDFEFAVKEVFQGYLEGDSDLALNIMLRDHNVARLERAKHRLRVVDANKLTSALACKQGISPALVHDDRYRGLYLQTTKQLRAGARQAGISNLGDKDTPLDVMSTYDLAMNELANMMALQSESPNTLFAAASGLRDLHEKQVGKPLQPSWQDNRMQPAKARKILSNRQMELPV